ncbi:MAG: hypothetical protein WCK59_02520 [Candidatus Falkowbacteria bacterium]
MTTEKNEPNAMAFYHRDGLTAAWQQAMMFAEKDGRIATMPDIVAARLQAKHSDSVWDKYYTTLTAEYVGYSRGGNLVLVVAHGIGPMATLEGIQKAYSWQYNDKSRNRRGGRITEKEFLDLVDGKFGEVYIVDLKKYLSKYFYEYPFIQILTATQAASDPVLNARFGPQCQEYIQRHTAEARAWHREQAGLDPENKYNFPEEKHQRFVDNRRELHLVYGAENSNPYIIGVKDESNCSYKHQPIEKGYALAHLISTSGLCHLHHENKESLVLDVSCHSWSDGTRLVGIKAGGGDNITIYDGPDPDQLLKRYWSKLWQPVSEHSSAGFCRLVNIGSQHFAQYQKNGNEVDNSEPEYMVKTMEKIGEPVLFRTEILGYYGFFRYDVNAVKAIAPPMANAYKFTTNSENEWHDGNPTHQTAMVQFYKIEADTTKRLIRVDQLARDYHLMMNFLK